MHEVFHGGGHGLVHHLQPGRNDAAAMIPATASPAMRMSSKLAMMQRASCGLEPA